MSQCFHIDSSPVFIHHTRRVESMFLVSDMPYQVTPFIDEASLRYALRGYSCRSLLHKRLLRIPDYPKNHAHTLEVTKDGDIFSTVAGFGVAWRVPRFFFG